jgi:transcriptional regulator with XRE-family HTH domain
MDDKQSLSDSRSTLSDKTAEELRALLARRRLSGRDLARRLDVSPSWVSYRLTGTTEIGLNDLERIADALDVEVAELLPLADQPAEQVLTRRRRLPGSYPIATTAATPTQPDSHHIRPSVRPAGSPRSMSRVPAQTTASISRPARLSHPAAPAPHSATSR